MQHKRRRGDARQEVENIDVSKGLQQPGCIFGRGRDPLQVVEPAHLLERGIGQEQRCQDLPNGRVVLRPASSRQGDHGFVHLDHGYLSLSLVAAMVMELGVIPPDAATGLNYGLDKVRFIAPVRAGARVRMRATLASVEPQNGGRMLLKLQSTLEIEGEAKPALVAELLCMLIGKRDASS